MLRSITLFLLALLIPAVVLSEDVTIEWDAPTMNTDDSPLTDLSGYILYWDTTSHVGDGAYSNFRVLDTTTNETLTGLAPGTYYVAVKAFNLLSIESAFSNELSFTVSASAPSIEVQGNGQDISDGDISPSSADHTDFGSADLSIGVVTRTFTIRNTGSAALSLSGSPRVSISGTHASDFTVSQMPASSIAAGASDTFQVRFDPAAVGTRTAEISISNNDAGANPFNFSIRGVGMATPVPEVDVAGNGNSIPDGDTSPRTADFTDFSNVSVNGSGITRTFTIRNTGTAGLTISGSPRVTISGPNAGDFAVTQQPSGSISAGGSSNFLIRFRPSATGTRSATISFANNDSNENPYNFSIRGQGIAPEISLRGNGAVISDGDNSPRAADHTDFGTIEVGGSGLTRTYTIENTGSDVLRLTGSPRVTISGAEASDFTVVSQPGATVAAGGSATFQVLFAPSAAGIRNASLSIANDDANENPYNFSIRGEGVVNAPEIAVTGNGADIADGDNSPSVADHTDFGSVATDAVVGVTRVFTVTNSGNAPLSFSGNPRVVVAGTHAADFQVTADLPATLAAGASVNFSVQFKPTAEGARSALIGIANNDSDENPFNFNVGGQGQEPPSGPAAPQNLRLRLPR